MAVPQKMAGSKSSFESGMKYGLEITSRHCVVEFYRAVSWQYLQGVVQTWCSVQPAVPERVCRVIDD